MNTNEIQYARPQEGPMFPTFPRMPNGSNGRNGNPMDFPTSSSDLSYIHYLQSTYPAAQPTVYPFRGATGVPVLGPEEDPNWRAPVGGLNSESSGPAGFSFQKLLNNSNRNRRSRKKKAGTTSKVWDMLAKGEAEAETLGSSKELEEKFEEQVKKFPQLPMDIHKKIQTMFGNLILDYFDVTVVRFQSNNIVDTQKCHAIFTTKVETGMFLISM